MHGPQVDGLIDNLGPMDYDVDDFGNQLDSVDIQAEAAAAATNSSRSGKPTAAAQAKRQPVTAGNTGTGTAKTPRTATDSSMT